jgi:RHS repeat-associated protein
MTMTLRGRLGILGTLAVAGGLAAFLSVRGPLVTSAFATDTDGDGLENGFETTYGTNPTLSDTDGDGINDFDEIFQWGTNPTMLDTDGDGTDDGTEALINHTDPLVNSSTGGTNNVTSTLSENLTAPAPAGVSMQDGHGVLVHSGDFTHSVEFLRIRAGLGPDIVLSAGYRMGVSYDGVLGNNWFPSWGGHVVENGTTGDVTYYPGYGSPFDPPRDTPPDDRPGDKPKMPPGDGGGGDGDGGGGWPGGGIAVSFTKSGSNYVTPTGVFLDLTKNGGAGTFTLEDPHGNTTTFRTSDGQMTAQTDRFGNGVTYSYNGSGQLSSITDAAGHTATFAYYGTGRVNTITDGDSRVVTFNYNVNDQLANWITPTSTQWPAGLIAEFRYSSGSMTSTLNDNLTRAIDFKGQTWLKNEFDSSDRIVKQYVGNDYLTFSYNTGTGVTTVYDREGNQRDWTWSGALVSQLKEYSNRNVRSSDPSYWTTTYGYSGGLLNKVVHPRTNRVDLTHDSSGNLTERRRKETDTASTSSSDLVDTWTYDTSHYSLVTSYTDPNGNQTSYTLASSGGNTNKVIVTVTHPTVTYLTPDQTVSETYTWSSAGQLLTRTDGEGYATGWTYVGGSGVKQGYVDHVTVDTGSGHLNLATTYAYTNWGTVTSVTNPRSKTTTYTVDEYDRILKSETGSPQGYEVVYFYDANGNLGYRDVENVDKTNTRDTGNPWFRTSFTYDMLNNVASRVEEIDATHTRTWSFDYTKNDRLKTVTKPEGNKIRFVYDERDLVYTKERGYTSGVASTETYDYDENRNLVTYTNGRAKSWTYIYDNFDRRTRATNPVTNYTTYVYDKDSNRTEVKRYEEAGSTDVLLEHTKHDFDEMSREYRVERGLYTSSWTWLNTTSDFDMRSLVVSVEDACGSVTSFTYDGAGRPIGSEDALGNTVDLTLDANGNVTQVDETETTGYTTAKTFVTERDFDEVDRLKEERVVNETSSSDKHTTTFKYDSLNVLVERTDPESNVTTWTHDGLSRVLIESISLGSSTYKTRTWGFDKNDRLTSHKDDANNETTWAWNARDLVTTETYADTYAKDLDYDAADNLTQWIDPNGTQVDLTYDDNSRNTDRTITRGSGVVGTTAESYTYDALDRNTEAQDDDVTVDLTYDTLSQKLTEVSGPNPMGSSGKTTSYTYDNCGMVTGIAYPDGSFSVSRTLDDDHRATLIEDGSSNDIVAVDYYGGGGRLKKLTFGNSTTAEHGYNGFRWVSDLDHKTSTPTTFAGYDLTYDKVGNIIYEEWSHDSGKGHNYTYDKAYRLTKTLQHTADPSAEYASPGSQTYDTKIEYNLTDDSDRSSVVTTPYGLSGTTVSYTSSSTHAYTVVGGTNRTYDNNGNLTDDGTFTYAYDYRNQLVTATRKSNSHTEGAYLYDALGRRTKATLYSGASVRYYHDGVHEIEEYDGSGAVLRKYVYRQDIDSVAMMEGRDLADVDNDSNTSEFVRLYYHCDSRGNVARLTDASEAVVESYEYDPYGIVTIKDKLGGSVSATQVGNPFDLQRRRRDGETGLMYFRARIYEPTAGNWLQRDPLSLEPGPNWHEFESSNPINRRDPMGMDDDECDGMPPKWDISWTGAVIATGVGAARGCVAGGPGALAGAATGAFLYVCCSTIGYGAEVTAYSLSDSDPLPPPYPGPRWQPPPRKPRSLWRKFRDWLFPPAY